MSFEAPTDPYLPTDVTTISRQEATERLSKMQADYEAQQKAERAAAVTEAEKEGKARDAQRSLSAALKMTPDQAATRLAELASDKDWYERWMGGNVEARREFDELTEAKAAGPLVESLIDGSAAQHTFMETTANGALPVRAQLDIVEALRAAGVGDDALRQLLSGAKISPAERYAADQLHKQLTSDSEWTKKLLDGDHAATKQFHLLSIIRSAEVDPDKK